jgi:hypothetical protein
MPNDLISRVFAQQWTLFVVVTVLLLAFSEAGFRLGLRLFATKDEGRKTQIGGVQGAVLGLLGLLLGFTFAMAVNHYDGRRGLVLKEANAIGTTWLRASLLPEARVAPVKDLLRRYTEVRLNYQRQADDPATFAEGLRLCAGLQGELWQHATAASKEAPTAITGTFIVALNETIDVDAERLAAGRATIPAGVWLLVIIVAACGCFTTSYGAGAEGERSKLGGVFLPLLFVVVIVLVFDLSHSRRGMITVSQQPLVDLLQSIQP